MRRNPDELKRTPRDPTDGWEPNDDEELPPIVEGGEEVDEEEY